jgi:prophage regulatory protein
MNVNAMATDRLIRIEEVLHIWGFSRSSIYASLQKGEFPTQVKLSKKASAWVYSEVAAWVTGFCRIVEWNATRMTSIGKRIPLKLSMSNR